MTKSLSEEDDPTCGVCGDLRSLHVATKEGPLTHPRQARGEGVYRLVRQGYTMAGRFPGEEVDVPPVYEFVSKEGNPT